MHTISPASSACSQAWHDYPPVIAWERLLGRFADLCTRPSAALFTILVGAWVLCPGRRTVTRMIGIGDPDGEHAHDAYHRFLRAGAWTMARLWCRLLCLLLAHLELGERLVLDLDDTLFHKLGRKVNGAGSFRDPIRSRGQHTVFAHGLNLLVLTLRVRPPWGGEPLGLPINMRLYRKGGPSLLDLGQAMIEEVAGWLPDRHFLLGCDGAYAPLAGRELPRTHLVSRIKRNAAIFETPPPRRPGQRGRPRKKGARLPRTARPQDLRGLARGDRRDARAAGQVPDLVSPVFWYAVRQQPILLVVVADPQARQPDDLFFTTDLDLAPEEEPMMFGISDSSQAVARSRSRTSGSSEAPAGVTIRPGCVSKVRRRQEGAGTGVVDAKDVSSWDERAWQGPGPGQVPQRRGKVVHAGAELRA